MIGGGVAGEEAAVACVGCFIFGGLVVGIKVALVTCGMAIEQGGDERVGDICCVSSGGHLLVEAA